jgi:hypothetical protein
MMRTLPKLPQEADFHPFGDRRCQSHSSMLYWINM